MNFKEPKFNLYDLFVIVICYFIAMALVMYAIKPVEAVFNDNVAVVSYLFLPHGIRIIAAMAYGPVNSFIYLLFAHLVAMVTLQEAYADPANNGSSSHYLLSSWPGRHCFDWSNFRQGERLFGDCVSKYMASYVFCRFIGVSV